MILVVDDDLDLVDVVRTALEREGFAVDDAGDGETALTKIAGDTPELVVLDLGLPKVRGLDVLRRVRVDNAVPVIVLSGRSDEADRILGLELGADDYVVKPFGSRELIARIRAVTRRTYAAPPDAEGVAEASAADVDNVQRLGVLTLDRRSHRVLLREVELILTPKEYDLLAILAEDPGALRTRGEIIDQVWDSHWYGPTKTLDVHIASLRKKLGDTAWIETVRGVGFRLRPIE